MVGGEREARLGVKEEEGREEMMGGGGEGLRGNKSGLSFGKVLYLNKQIINNNNNNNKNNKNDNKKNDNNNNYDYY